ncbi:unnamed protein product [Auanema sp. JU1783]|nr:unnamed protein product [Auanema sp. JU1783]
MGADGGTIPKRCELVQKKKKVEKIDKAVKNATKWENCQLTQQPLKKPIIACRLGRLFSKEAVLEAILTKTIKNFESASHIRGMKDFKELKLRENKDYKADNQGVKGDSYLDINQTEFLCPITSVPMNGNYKFVVNWKCGCVFSEKALEEVKTDTCHGCGGPWDVEESIKLNPDEETLELYKKKLEEERLNKKNKKKDNKDADKKKDDKKDEDKKKAEKRKAETEIQADPSKSDVYKKLFTTSKEAMSKPQSHWVTYNPLYY